MPNGEINVCRVRMPMRAHSMKQCVNLIEWTCAYWDNMRYYFIHYFARNWPWYNLRGLHIRITWFSLKTSDTALLSVIALTTFNCIVSASVTKGAFVCFVATVHWWRHRTHYDVTKACRALRNIPTVHLNNGAPRADLRGIPKHCEVTAKAGRQSTIYTGGFDAIFFIKGSMNQSYEIFSGLLTWTSCLTIGLVASVSDATTPGLLKCNAKS